MIDYNLLKLIPCEDEYYEFCYQVKKAAEGVYIAEIWGWDENIQREYFNSEWSEIPRNLIIYKGNRIGTIAVKEDDERILLQQFFILPEYQNRGIGSYLLKTIMKQADETCKITRLKFLKNNPVKSLYLRHGFQIIGEEEYFHLAERTPVKKAESREE